MASKKTCESCGQPFIARGATAKRCLSCRSTKNRSRDRRRAEVAAAKGDDVAVEMLSGDRATVADQAAERAHAALAGQRLAVAIGLAGGDMAAARAIAGLSDRMTDVEFAALVEQATLRHAELIEGRRVALAGVLQRVLALLSLRLLGEAQRLPPPMLPAAVKQVGGLLDVIGGAGILSYPTIELIVGDDEAA